MIYELTFEKAEQVILNSALHFGKKRLNWNCSLWSRPIRATTRTGQNHSQEEYLWEIVRPHITVSWYVTVTSIGWPHMKIIKSDDGGTLTSRNRQTGLEIFVNKWTHTNANRLTKMQSCVQVHIQTNTHKHTHTVSTPPLFTSFFFSPTKPQTLLSTHMHCPAQCYHMQAINMPQMSKTWGRCRSGKIPKCLCPTHSWPLNTADLRYSNTASFKTSNLSHTRLSYQHKSKSKSADVSYPVFQREKHLTWSPILYEDNVLYPVQPHQIIMRSKIFNPQEHSREKCNCVFFVFLFPEKSKFLESFYSVSLWGLTYIFASGGFSRR